MKFYKHADGYFVVGNQIIPSGIGRLVFSDTTIKVVSIETDKDIIENILITSLEKESGVAYVSLADLLTATSDFFTSSGNSIISVDSNSVEAGIQFKSFIVEITRPVNTTVYSANDVVADSAGAIKPFLNVAKYAGYGVKILRVRLQTDDTGVSGKKFNVHLYRDTPTFITDNDPFVIAYANAVKRIGAVPIVMGTGNLATVGMNDYNIVMANPVARDITFILETVDGFTPSANSTKFTVTIDCELSN